MPELNLNVILAGVAYAAITGVLNLLLSERSRVDAWAANQPRLASLLKLLRAVGFDPWLVVASASLMFKGRLPRPKPAEDVDTTVRIVPAVLLCCGLALSQQACGAAQRLPCDEQKLAAIDAAYVAKVTVECLPKYDVKEECPAWEGLRAEHRAELKAECGQ